MEGELFNPEKSEQSRQQDAEVCCPLPFTLQDLCLLVTMSSLDTYPRDLLASLPLWMRKRLLKILPDLDLCYLECTSVAAGVDVEAIWNSRPAPEDRQFALTKMQDELMSLFQLKFSSRISLANDEFLKEIKSAFNDMDLISRKKAIFSVLSDVLAKVFDTSKPKVVDLDEDIYRLISIESKLLSSFMHQPCQDPQCSQKIWKNQATALTVNTLQQASKPYETTSIDKILLTPHDRQLTSYRDDPLKLLNFVVKYYNLQPSSAYVHIDFIYDSLCSERLTLSSSSGPNCTAIVNHLLGEVIILTLQCDNYSKFEVMVGIVKAALENTQLKYLFCSMPNLHKDIIQPLSSIFLLQNFHQLVVDVEKVSPMLLCELLHEFMTVHCSCTQKLILNVKYGPHPTLFRPGQLAALNCSSLFVPFNFAEYKVLQFSPQKDIFDLLLHLPIIRLKKISVDDSHLHLCSQHPNLYTTKLVIDLTSTIAIETIHADLVALFGMLSLQKITISGKWGKFHEIKRGLIKGLSNRTRFYPLKKIGLELTNSDYYKLKDFQQLCDALFSLPEVENLKVVFGHGFVSMIKCERFEEILYTSWKNKASKVQLKSICLRGLKLGKFKYLSLVAKQLTVKFRGDIRDANSIYYHSEDNYDDAYYGGYSSSDYDY